MKRAVLLLLFLMAGNLFGAGSHKFQIVDKSLAPQIVASGGRLIADYSSYQLYDVPASATNAARGRVRDEYNTILLNTTHLDTSTPQTQALRKTVGDFAGKRMHLVHFAGPVQPDWRRELIDAGVQIVSYIPQNAYLVYGDSGAIAKVQALASAAPEFQWDGEYLDDYKIHPSARSGKTDQFAIQLVADIGANPMTLNLLDKLKLAPFSKREKVLNYVNIIVCLNIADLSTIAARPDVVSIHPYFTPQKFCERQDQIVAGNLNGDDPVGPGYLAWLESKGFGQSQFTASGFIVDITDSGIDNGTTTPNHFGLYANGLTNDLSRVAYSRLQGTSNSPSTLKGCDGHGTLNAHIIGGFDAGTNFPFADSSGFAYGLGVCPFVRVGASVIFDPDYSTSPNLSELEADAYAKGARINNNSWGDNEGDGIYGIDSQQYDSLVRDAQQTGTTNPAPGNQQMVIIFAAGNYGPNATTVDEPATAKNVITVGAAENVQLFGGEDGCGVGDDEADSANEIDPATSRGPCGDGRQKPDLMAPGTHVSGGVIQAPDPGPDGTADPCFDADGICGGVGNNFYPSFQQFYSASSGTSHSAPAVAGGCALLRQYFINHGLLPPSPAMTKAWLMNSARYMTGSSTGGTLWSATQGMGEMDLGVAFDGTPRVIRDEEPADTFTASGQSRTFTGTVANTNLPFLVTVAWTDAPGNTSGASYNNDLDLTVTVGGQTYLGNNFSGAYSVTGGSPDTKNNVESVFLPAGTSGPFTVTVAGTSINSIGVPNPGDALSQDFALVIDNASASGSPVIVSVGATLVGETCMPTNGAIDPGETVTVNFALQNTGVAPTTNLVATLIADGGIISPSNPATYDALLSDGTPVSKPFTFTAEGECGGTITATLQLQDGSANLGQITFILTLGQLVTVSYLTQNFDTLTPPSLPSGWTTSVSGGQTSWTTTNSESDTSPNSAFAPATTNAGIANLITPTIPISSPTSQLSFRQYYALEVNPDDPAESFDGGVLEIQVGTNTFKDILSAGGSFVTNGYNTTISSVTGNPLPSRQAWSGDSGGFIPTIVNLPAAADGQNIQLRWRCATDTGNEYGSTGWWIDTISVSDGGHYVCCEGSPLLFNVQLAPAGLIFSFQTASNVTYDIQYKNALTDSEWSTLKTITGNGATTSVTNAVSSNQGYYRVRSP